MRDASSISRKPWVLVPMEFHDSCSTFRSQCFVAISAYATLVKFNPSILHMQNCLAPAICERRAYHTRSLWHPKFHLDFSKKIIWLKGGDLSFSFKRTLPFKIFLWQEFYLVSPKTWFWSWRFFPFIWTQTKILLSWKNVFWQFLEKPYSFWNDLFPLSTNLSCHDLSANPLS